MLIQIITEVQFIIVPYVSKMDMIHLVRKSFFSISLIERDSVWLGGHDDKTVLFQYLYRIFQVNALRNKAVDPVYSVLTTFGIKTDYTTRLAD